MATTLPRPPAADDAAAGLTRAQFLKGAGVLVVGFSMAGSLLGALSPRAQAAAASAPQDITVTPALDAWLAVKADGTVEIFQSKRELGQGVFTAINQIAAEELSLPLSSVTLHQIDTLITPYDGGTDGSTSIPVGGSAVRLAAATAYQALLAMAAKQLGVSAASLTVANGVFTAAGGKTASYGQLIGGQHFDMSVNPAVPLKSYTDYTTVGQSVPRLDLPQKLTGANGPFQYTVNVRVPGMVHARFMRPPAFGATIVSMNSAKIKAMPGVIDVVTLNYSPSMQGWTAGWTKPVGQFVAVVADTEGHALTALTALEAATTWTQSETLPGVNTPDAQGQYVRSLTPFKTTTEGVSYGNVPATLKASAKTLSATYYTPWQTNGPIGPSIALADVSSSKAVIYTASQSPFSTQSTVAAALGMKPSQVEVIAYDGAGGYGRSGTDDPALEAALLSQQVGRPVRVQWMRGEEFTWSTVRTPMAFEFEGGLAANGQLLGWQSTVWSDSHLAVPFTFGATYGGNGLPPYAVKARNTTVNYVKTALRVGSMRSLGGWATVFAHESFIDEMAYLAGQDPLQFRLNNLTDQRAQDVLEAAADKFGYVPHVGPRANGSGVGVSLVADLGASTYVAHIAEVNVDMKTGQVSVPRISVAHDCGLMINPNGVQNQVQGGTVQALSWTLHEILTMDKSSVTSLNWIGYPILRYPELPTITVTLINRPSLGAKGVGEPASMGVGALVGNGIYDATGVRMRATPFTAPLVLAGIQSL